jgi:predicted nucleic acid-binding protein
MIVVADTSPFVVLVAIGHVDVLLALFKEVLIPPPVASELASSRRPPEVRTQRGIRAGQTDRLLDQPQVAR